MSEENVEIVRRAYEAQTEGRLDDWFEFLDPEIEWRGPREFPDLAEPHFGHEGTGRGRLRRRTGEEPIALLLPFRFQAGGIDYAA